MGYWKAKVLPKIKKVFEKNTVKKEAAAEACKSFDDSKEDYTKEFEEKKAELKAKVIELYEALSADIKKLIKEPKETGIKKYSAGVEKFFDELVKIEFPGSKPVKEACTKCGPALVPGPIIFVFEKVSTFIVVEEKKAEAAPEKSPAKAEEETSGAEKEKEVVIEEGKKEEVEVVVVAVEEQSPLPPKVEEATAPVVEPPKAC